MILQCLKVLMPFFKQNLYSKTERINLQLCNYCLLFEDLSVSVFNCIHINAHWSAGISLVTALSGLTTVDWLHFLCGLLVVMTEIMIKGYFEMIIHWLHLFWGFIL
jgi:hypothetical protein